VNIPVINAAAVIAIVTAATINILNILPLWFVIQMS
jgi:hypothetical protein